MNAEVLVKFTDRGFSDDGTCEQSLTLHILFFGVD